MLLACQNISKAYGTNQILTDVSFHIEAREKIAIVGINGCGKTTLLKVIMGEEAADNGQVVISKEATVGYLSQHQDISFDNTIYDEMLETKKYIIDMEAKLRSLELDMKEYEGDRLEQIMNTYNKVQSEYDRLNGYAYKSEITGVLKGLGFSEADYNRHISTLSGGQKMRIALGRLLLTKPDIIILDEPTNHLDMLSTAWLETFLSAYDGSVIIVSHDRYFIDKIATKIVEIDNTKATIYHGNYSYYAKKRAEVRASLMKAYLNQQQEIKHQEDVITKLKQFNREKSIKRAESREKMLAKIDVLEKPVETASEMRLALTPSVESGNDVLTIRELSKSFGSHNLFSSLNMDIKKGERVSLIGANGTGKTTILKIINRVVPKDAGTVTLGSRVRIGYYDQEHQVLSLHKTIFEEISDAYPDMNNTKIRNVLAAFLFTGEDVFKKIGELRSKEILEEALKSYTGTVLVVSHDRYFINSVSTRIVELKDKRLYSFIGNYDYYETHRDIVYGAVSENDNVAGSTIQKPSMKTVFTAITDNTPAQPAQTGSMSSSKEEYLKNKEEQTHWNMPYPKLTMK